MENMQMPREMSHEYFTEVKRSNPKIYDRVMPYIHRMVDNLDYNLAMTNEEINNLTNNIIAESNIMMSPPEHHNRETIFDVVKMLLIMELEDMDEWDWEDDGAMPAMDPMGFDADPFFFPSPFFFPFFFRRRHRRHHRREHEREERGRRRF